jgi:DNA-3-methyladenine glycosylase
VVEAAERGPALLAPSWQVLDRSCYEGDSLEVAPNLLNKLLVVGELAARIVEVECYRGEEDPASHAYRGRTRRNATMFGPPGRLYVYFTYGMHWCANVVCAAEGVARAVLLRAAEPVAGTERMRRARSTRRAGRVADTELLAGPARLCEALGIVGADDGADLVTGDRGIVVATDGTPPPKRPGRSGRVGIRQAAELPWRFFVEGSPSVSRAPREPPGVRPQKAHEPAGQHDPAALPGSMTREASGAEAPVSRQERKGSLRGRRWRERARRVDGVTGAAIMSAREGARRLPAPPSSRCAEVAP